jgi:hypothetical protein
MVELAHHQAGAIERQPDLLLMMPAFREFARHVEPVRRRGVAGPAHGEVGRQIRIALRQPRAQRFGGRTHQAAQHRRAQPSVDGYAFGVERSTTSARLGVAGRAPGEAVAGERQPAKGRVGRWPATWRTRQRGTIGHVPVAAERVEQLAETRFGEVQRVERVNGTGGHGRSGHRP